MKLKLNYRPTYQFSNRDIFDASEDELVYEVLSRPPGEWASAVREWVLDGATDPAQAIDGLAMVLVAVQQGSERFIIKGRDAVQDLRDTIEQQNPGFGDQFVIHLCLGHYNYHFNRLADLSKNLPEPLPRSGNGTKREPSKSAVKSE